MPAPDERFVARLRELEVEPLSVGRSIVATWEPNETKVLEAIRDLGLELNITFNKGAVMVLPAGVNKASGLRAALKALEISPLNCVAVGDAENDMAFLDVDGLSIAVANAIPMLKEHAAWVTDGVRGEGVAELVGRLLATDLADIDADIARQHVVLGQTLEGEPITTAPHRESLLLAGGSGGGKSTLTQGLTERLAEAEFQFCIIDPEGDYDGLEGAVVAGDPQHTPTVEQINGLLRNPETNVVVNLLGLPVVDRPGFLGVLLPELLAMRSRYGRPHMIIIDETHHVLPADWDPSGAALPSELKGVLFITTCPGNVSPRLLACVDRLLVVGEGPRSTLDAFCHARGLTAPSAPESLSPGEMLLLDTHTGTLRRARTIPGHQSLKRHQRKYAEGKLGEDNSFWFRGPDARLNLRAHNLTIFVQMADGVDLDTWQWHRERGDFSHWVEDAIKDRDLAGEIAEIEAGGTPPDEARHLIREAVERRYTQPG